MFRTTIALSKDQNERVGPVQDAPLQPTRTKYSLSVCASGDGLTRRNFRIWPLSVRLRSASGSIFPERILPKNTEHKRGTWMQ